MTPTPEYKISIGQNKPTLPYLDGDRVVISGMSGIFPKSNSVKELSEILYNKINPVVPTSRFIFHHPEVVQYVGNVTGLGYFDAQFFKVHYRQANCMDPMGKKVLEQAYQAIYDAGINPDQLSGKKVGVYIGSCLSESEKVCFYDSRSRTGFTLTGCSKTMLANRISYWLNAKGPSISIDEACCSSAAAIEQAYLAISRGECEAAIVGGSHLYLHPQSSVHYGRIIKLCRDGKTKSFDERADGCAKSEAINVLFLQKASNALRIYAEVVHVKTEFTSMLTDDTGPKHGFSRNYRSTANFIRKFYEDINISPQVVEYVEAFGSAMPEADKSELEAIEEVLCNNRDGPLLIGSVMSNIGYVEAASGISATIKVLLGYHYGKLAANLHCERPRKDITALREGQMRILTEHQRFNCTYAAVNGMSVTGANSHILLYGHHKPKDLDRYKTSIPYLVTVSGRHQEAVKHVHEILKSNPIDPEQLALLHNIHQTSVSGHMGRGFIILKSDEEQNTVSLFEISEYFDDMRRPLWFVYSGMGSQWAGMGADLMRIPIFAAAIERCRIVLEPKGLDIIKIITSPDETIFNNILNSFVGIAAIQIGLTDVLHAIGLKPHGIIGHSVGELGCAYADGCLTAEEMILAAYYRGLVSLETKFIHGSMAAVGMGYEQVSKICPPEIEVACHNGPDSSTISGPSDIMRDFVAELSKKQIFAKEVPCSNIAYHSRYIADAGPGLLKYLTQVITNPKPRSKRWISSSVPQNRWNEPIAKLCSCDYLTNNLLSPVLFEETSRLIPKNAVLVEIAPHGLLQAILKRSMPDSCVNIPLTRRKHTDNTFLLLQAIGKLYMEGFNSNLQVLYPKVEMPVSTGTPFLSHFVKWAHEENWPIALYCAAERKSATNCNFLVALHDKEHSYIRGHSLRGEILYPFTASLMLAWETLAMTMGVPKNQLSVDFTDIKLHAQPILHDKRQLRLHVAINRGTGWFEILEGSSKVVTGFIKPSSNITKNVSVKEENINMYLNSEDIYQLLCERDYSYSGEFKVIEAIDESLSQAQIVWSDNWVTFIDGIIQLNVLRQAHKGVSLPIRIARIGIDVNEHFNFISKPMKPGDKILMKAAVSEQQNSTRCGGVSVDHIIFKNLPLLYKKMSLRTLKFVSHFQPGLTVSSSLEVYLHTVAENVNKDTITVIGLPNRHKAGSMFTEINNVIRNIFGLKVNYKEIFENEALTNYSFKDVDLVLVQDLSINENVRQKLQQVIQRDQFIVSEENIRQTSSSRSSSFYRIVSVHSIDQYELRLVRWQSNRAQTGITTISVQNEGDINFLNSVYANLASHQRLLIIAPYPSPRGLKELVFSWRKESKRNNIHLVSVNDDSIDNFEDKLNDIELAFNVVHQGGWGGEFYIPCEDNAKVTNVTLQNLHVGDYDSLHWVEVPTLTESRWNITVHYAGINNYDIKKSNGLFLPKHNIGEKYGQNFSGVTERGERVMGIIHSGAMSTKVRAQPELLWPVPEHWSLEEAATVPLAYMQAFYCLGIKAELHRGYSVLVNEGETALGQAIISILLAFHCQVFTTVSDKWKKDFLLKLYPTLKADHIGYSRDESFGDMVLNATKEGCHIVISSIKGNLKNINMKCLTLGGTCCDITQIENHEDYLFGMSHLDNDKKFVCVDLSSILDIENNLKDIMDVSQMLSDGIASGYVRPLSYITFRPQEVAHAFRFRGSDQHHGQVLLHMKDIQQVENRLTCKADNYHFILCGDLKFGIQFAENLISQGVKKLCIYVKTQSSYLLHKMRLWQSQDVEIVIYSQQLKDSNDLYDLLKSILNLGALEGVYITTNKDNHNIQNIINSLDSATRTLCSDIRYFAVLNIGNCSVGKEVCMRRTCDNLPATIVMIPELNNEPNDEYEKLRSAANAVERALHSSQNTLLVYTESESRPTILQRIAALADVNIPDNAEKSLTLGELGINNLQEDKLYIICSALQYHYNLAFDKEQIPSMTLETISQLERTVIEYPYDDKRGLATFFSYVDSDELLATTEMVILPSLINSTSSRGDEFEPNQKNLYIVPGLEGHHERFRVLCERLKLPAIVLQPGFDNQHETLDHTAARFAEVLLKRNEIKDTFYLLGYESGIYIALEIAAILEDNGLTGTIYCLGGSPNELHKEIEEQLAEYKTEEQLCDAVVKHMIQLMIGDDTELDLDTILRNISSRSEKIDVGVRALLGRVSHSAQYAKAIIEAALSRIEHVRQYSAIPRQLRSQLVLLRTGISGTESEDASLQQYSTRPVAVHQLHTPLAHSTKDLRCAAIINEYLDPQLVKEFSMRNLCDSYLINPSSFMSLVNEAE